MLRTRRRARPASCARGTTRATPRWLLRQPGLGLVELALASFPAEVSGFPGRGRRWADYRSPRPTGNGEISAPRHPTGGRTQHDGRQDEQGVQNAQDGAEVAVPQGREAGSPRRREPSDREGRRRRPRAGLHRGPAGLETRRRAPPGRAHRAHRPWRAQGGQMELAAVRSRGRGLVPRHPYLHELRQGDFLPRHVAESRPPGESKNKDTRYLDIHENDQLDEAQLAGWVKQASELPGAPSST